MSKLAFVSARDAGYRFAIGKDPEQAIFQAMEENPYKSEKAREDFVEGASRFVSQMSEIRTHRMIYGSSHVSD